MTTTNKWQEALHVSKLEYQKWQEQAGSDSSVTSWALDNNKIHAEQYFTWAMSYYNIPFLKETFFHQLSINSDLWNRTKKQAKWNKHFLPIYQWQGLTFAACLEPPKEKDKTIIPILATPDKLQFCWQKIQSFTQPHTVQVPTESKKETPPDTQTESSIESETISKVIATKIHNFLKTSIFKKPNVQNSPIFAQVIEQTKEMFPQSIIFTYKKGEFTPIKWSATLKGVPAPVSIDQASIFKIVRKSKQPYHGFVVENKQHNQFFIQWGFKKIPPHVTLAPVFMPHTNEKKMIGAFMGIATASISPEALTQITNWCKPLEKAFTSYQNDSKQTPTQAA